MYNQFSERNYGQHNEEKDGRTVYPPWTDPAVQIVIGQNITWTLDHICQG